MAASAGQPPAAGPSQSYASHAHRPLLWQVTFIMLTVGAGLLTWAAIDEQTMRAAALALLGVGAVLLAVVQRRATLKLQNRIILTEMRARLTRLERAADLQRLTPRQLIALRFAGDGELPGLIERAATEQLSSKAIKQAVTDWQGDYFRT